MANYAKFISTDYLYKNTIIDDNVDADLLNKFIVESQDINIQQVLGNALYQKLMDDIVTSTTPSGSYLTLLTNFIQKCQAEWVVYHALPFINYRLTNKSVAKKDSEYSDASDLDEVKYLRQSVRDKAEFYSKMLSDYLCKNESLFPEYTSDNDHTIRPSRNNYFSGIYLGKSNRK
jgi:hypothetical protein